ncbi:MAG: SdiA-regulated domain-containing protein [Candidatus Brocadiia bacterium]
MQRSAELVLTAVLLFAACFPACRTCPATPTRRSPRINLPYEWMGDIEESGFNEPSGIVYDHDRGTLFVVGDEGDICEMTTDGKMLRQKVLERGRDLEGLARVPETGLLYVAVEGEEKVLEVPPDDLSIMREFQLPRNWDGVELFKPGGNGVEAICFVPDPAHPQGGTFFVSNQSFTREPGGEKSLIVRVGLPLRPTDATEPVRILHWFDPGIIDISALTYLPSSGHLLAVSDAANVLMEFTTDGRLLREFAFTGANQEGLTLDENGLMYVAQDSGGVIKIRPLWPEESQ